MAQISVRHLTKRFGSVHAVEDLSFNVAPGHVTGFLGPNGAGKTTTLRAVLGLVRPTSGEALIDGRRYDQLAQPRRVVGAVLESTGAHPGRTARAHLHVLATATAVPLDRVDEVLKLVGLTRDAERHVGGYSLGMRQRLGLAGALLGDPEVLLLDEPANGLDPEGIAWLRGLLRGFAASGRTVLISSHLLSEVAQTVDQVVIISDGRLKFAGRLGELGEATVSVRTEEIERLRASLGARGFEVLPTGEGGLEVRGATAEEIGRLASDEGIALLSLGDARPSLEAAFLRLTGSPDLTTPPAPAN